MEKSEIAERRRLLAEALRKGNPDYGVGSIPQEQIDLDSRKLCVPEHLFSNWFRVYDSLGNPINALFVNRMSNQKSDDLEGIVVPPENHNGAKIISIEISEETPDKYLSVLDRYSCLCMDLSKVKSEFRNRTSQKHQEVIVVDNNANSEAVAARRRALAEALRTGAPVVVTASGEVEKKEDAQEQGLAGIQVPDGKLA